MKWRDDAELIADLWGGEQYEWDLLEVWRRKSDGRLFYYADGGCSCNSPYDGVRGWDDLSPLTSIDQFRSELYSSLGTADERMRAVADVAAALRNYKKGQ